MILGRTSSLHRAAGNGDLASPDTVRRTEVEILRAAVFILNREVFNAAFKVALTQIAPYPSRPFGSVIVLR